LTRPAEIGHSWQWPVAHGGSPPRRRRCVARLGAARRCGGRGFGRLSREGLAASTLRRIRSREANREER